MKILKKILKITLLSILILLAGSSVFLYFSGPELPKGTNKTIEQVMNNPLPELVKGQSGIVTSQGLDIWYESISPEDSAKGAILLIMGISNDALAWPQKFIRAFVDSGYQVVRYDHRGTGMSDWVKDWDSENPYSLADMANDAIAVLDELGISKAHIIGASMGGMIAQEIAIDHPDRVASLTSMMSTCNIMDPELPEIPSEVIREIVKVSLKYGVIGGEENMIKLQIAVRKILRGDANYKLNIKETAQQVLYNLRKRKGYNFNASEQHQAAVGQSGSRCDKLKNITIPAFVIHGRSDPLIPIEHGKKCASVIPNADTMWVENMGHDIPDSLVDTLAGRIISNFK